MPSKLDISYKTPKEARLAYRQGKHTSMSTYGLFPGYLQANIAIIPKEYADDFKLFCNSNQSACPLIYQSKPGECTVELLSADSDIRSDLTSYKVYKDGIFAETVNDLRDYEWEDMVTFYLGCSFSFDSLLTQAGIFLDVTDNVSMYLTNIPCKEVGAFHTNMVVSMRPIPKSMLQIVYEALINSDYSHGAPIHIGYPKDIGISIENEADYGSTVSIPKDHLPVFWACGVTSSEAVKNAKLPFSFSHSPGCMYITDTKGSEVMEKTSFQTYSKPKVVCLNENLDRYSAISENAWNLLSNIEKEIFEDVGKRGIDNLLVENDFNKAVLSLSKNCSKAAIILGFPVFSDKEPFEENDGIAGAICIAKALTKMGREVDFYIDKHSLILKRLLENCFAKGFISHFVSVNSIDHEENLENLLYRGELKNPTYTHLISIERPSRAKCGGYYTMKGREISDMCDPLDLLFQEAKKCPDITTIGIGDGGNEIGMGKVHDQVVSTVDNGSTIASSISCDYLITCGVSDWGGYAIAAGIFIACQCNVHDRYRRYGIESDIDISNLDDLMFNNQTDEKLRHYISQNGFRDGITGDVSGSVDGLAYEDVHQPKIHKIRTIATSV